MLLIRMTKWRETKNYLPLFYKINQGDYNFVSSMKRKKTKFKESSSLFDQKDFLVAISLFVFSFAIRITNLLSLPMYSDEALLLGWSKMVAENPAENLTLSIRADGYPPLTSWIFAFSFKLFPHPLFAGRFISVLAGAFSAAGIYFIGRTIYSKKVGILASLAYIFVPMNFFIDRYAYHDSLISFFAIYTLLFSLLFLKGKPKFQPLYFLSLGLSMGIGILSKTAAFLILFLPALAWFFLKDTKPKTQSIRDLKIISFSYIFPLISYLWLFSDPYSWLIIKKGRDLSMSLGEITSIPLTQWKTNLMTIGINLWYYLTPPLLLFSLYTLYKAIKEQNKNQLFFLSYFFLILFFFFLVSKGRIHFKYLAFGFPFLILAISRELSSLSINVREVLKKNFQKFKASGNSKLQKNQGFLNLIVILFLIILLIPSFQFDYLLSFNPHKSKLEPLDFELHLQSIFSGSQLDKCISFLRKESRKGTTLIILPHPDIAIIFYGLPLFLESTPNLYFIRVGTAFFYYQNGEKHCLNFAQQLKPQLGGSEKLLAVMPDDPGEVWPELFLKDNPEAKLIKKFVKPGGKSSINIYQIPY